MIKSQKGAITLAEVMISSLILVVVVSGTMAAFVTASRMQRTNGPAYAEATLYAQQTIESLRNNIACDSAWFNPANCAFTAPGAWTPANPPLPVPPAAGTESILNAAPARRCYRVQPVPPAICNGCVQVDVQVCWGTDQTGCNC